MNLVKFTNKDNSDLFVLEISQIPRLLERLRSFELEYEHNKMFSDFNEKIDNNISVFEDLLNDPFIIKILSKMLAVKLTI